tara:strand:- start:47 stop:217 length:171 start_codon:yes stop_codon:yes gene_type:complete
MRKIILLFLFIHSCSNSNINKVMVDDIDLYKDLSFKEFKVKIINYAKNSDYPNIKN